MQTEWRLTVADVLRRPLFKHAAVIAGSRGLARSIRWVHILEAATNAAFLNGGELVLSTGVGFGEDDGKRLAFMQGLIERGAAGLCVELGPYIPEIPESMRELSEHHQFPLIAFRKPVRFVDITLDLHESIVTRQTEALRHLEAYSRELQQLTLQTTGLPRLLAHFQAAVQTQVFLIRQERSPLFVPAMAHSVQDELAVLFEKSQQAGELSGQASGILSLSEQKRILYQPINAMGHVLAYLGVILYEQEPNEILLLTLDRTATAVAQLLLRSMFAEEQARDSQNRLLDDILQGRMRHERQLQTLLGIQPQAVPPGYFAVVMEIQAETPQFNEEDGSYYDLLSIFRSIVTRCGFRLYQRAKGERLYMLFVETMALARPRNQLQKAVNELTRTCRSALGKAACVQFGISRRSVKYMEADSHFREAEQVLALQTQTASSSPFYDDLGVYRLLLQITDAHTIDAFISDYLGPLLQYDERHGSQLVLTLRTLLDHNGSKQETADQLYIRRQTLYNRLDKIAELIGDTYLAPEHRLSLELALRAYAWQQRIQD
ncbi:PucR family transcriptional regulator [Brevibacillus sp. B_LB10_24]|uniref:PucR family transcriptional regulator n=1 Tax=Brevibacillus sp. B_LB10_24 TaxID=3380645 RepID=UPI0038BCD029